jgi:hypothetical protein
MLNITGSMAGQQTLISINDASGDDSGAGDLSYPQRADFEKGDLDLLQLNIARDPDGFWFEAKFKNAIKNPDTVRSGSGSESLTNFARKGFYQFNLDIYVDMDRVAGSGNSYTLPGRHVNIAPGMAWEKVVVLTPRPELMRTQLIEAIAAEDESRDRAATEAGVDKSVFFPTRIKVRARTISFFVPAIFFSNSDGKDWAITTLVTGALTTIPADFTLSTPAVKPLDRLQLGVMQPEFGHPPDTFGYTGNAVTPVVDVLAADAAQQAQQLAVGKQVSGVAWGIHANENAPANPVAETNTAPIIETKTMNTEMQVGKIVVPAELNAAQPPVPASAQTEITNESSIAKRLQTLQRLFDQKLIDQDEYKQQKQRILQAL